MTKTKWVVRKEVNDFKGSTRWVVARGSHRYTDPTWGGGAVKVFRTFWGAERRATKLNVSQGWDFL